MSKGDFNLEFKAYRYSYDTKHTGIVHVLGKDYKILAETFIRFQEHYESPHDHIRGKIFTLGQVRAAGRRSQPTINAYEGGKHFDTDWAGYNLPGYILQPFIQGLFDPLTEYEQDIVQALRYNQLDKIYVIGTVKDNDIRDALDHEICHALYYLNTKYKEEVNKALNNVELQPLKELLLDWGYNTDQLLDECHAYLSADYEWLHTKKADDVAKHKVQISKDIHEKLRKIKHDHFEDDWLKS